MSTRNEFINRIKKETPLSYDMPQLTLTKIAYPDIIKQFMEISTFVGGRAIELKPGEDLNQIIATLYPEARQIASNLPGITIATVNPDEITDPHTLHDIDLSVIQGEIGVAENGCVWIPQRVKQKVVYFISEYLVILLDKTRLVATMHDAYQCIPDAAYDFGVFISGPSKTADIEQALVVGAHGARGVTVILV